MKKPLAEMSEAELKDETRRTIEEGKGLDKEYEEKIEEIDGKIFGDEAKPLNRKALWDRLEINYPDKGVPACNVDNVVKVLEGFSEFKEGIWFDNFQRRIFTTWKSKKREWTDADDLQIQRFMQNKIGLTRTAKQTVQDAVSLHAHNNRTNEFEEWIKSLTWDGVERCEYFFDNYMGAPHGDYCRAVSKSFWVGMVARGCSPGCQLDTMIILEGEQGTFKSSALRAIGGKWFSEVHKSVKDTDFPLIFHGKLLLEFGEFNSFRRAEINAIKGIVTNRIDRLRSPYGKRFEDYPRTCSFVATTNDDAYLGDVTGARRFLPIRTSKIDLEDIIKFREQFFAEAYQLFKAGTPWWIFPESAKDEQEIRRQTDEWELPLRDNLEADLRSQFTIWEIAKEFLDIPLPDLNKPTQQRIGQCLRAIGLERCKSNGRIIWKKNG